MEVYRVLGESGVSDRFTAALSRGLSSLVGREEELDRLLLSFRRSRDGAGQVVLVSGEAGIGKSRLLYTLRQKIEQEAGAWWLCRCTPYTRNSALHPLIELVQSLLRFERDDSPEQKVRKLEKGLAPFEFPRSEAVPLLAGFLSLPLNGDYPPLAMTPQRQKEKTLEILIAILHQLAAEQPTVLVMEDLHWVDPSTLEFLEMQIARSEAQRVLTLLTFRPSFSSPWGSRPYLSHLPLERFSEREAERLMAKLTGGARLPAEVLRQLVEKTDGVPLFIEEVTKNILESGLLTLRGDRYELTEPLAPLSIPTTLRDSLTARLDRLGTAKEVAQLAAAIGRRFSYEVLSAVSPLADDALRRELGRLLDAELVYRTASQPAVFVFKHALIQDAAHDSLLKSQRREIHRRIARLLEEKFPAVAETRPEILARHFEEAQLTEEALKYRQAAGWHAVKRSAYVEAVSHFTQALELLAGLPEARARDEQELALRSSLGVGLIATKGYAASEIEQNYGRAQEICRELGDTPQLVPALYGLWVYHLLRGHRQSTIDLAQQLFQLADDCGSPQTEVPLLAQGGHLFIGPSALGITAFYDGEFVRATELFERAMGCYDVSEHKSLAQSFGDDAGLLPHFYHYWCLWLCGRSDEARARQQEATAYAEQIASPYVVATSLLFEMILAHELRDLAAVTATAERFIALSGEQGFPFFLALAKNGHGWCLVQHGEAEAGIAQIREGIASYRLTGAKLPVSYWLTYLTDALLQVGNAQEGLEAVDEALALARSQLDSFYEAEQLRLKGELLLLAEPDSGTAEECFRAALELARGQRAKAFELRTAMSLSRLLVGRGAVDEARSLLEGVRASFTQGFDTAELREAGQLLAELAGSESHDEVPAGK